MLLLRFECGSVTRTALENSENYHVSSFASGSFDAVCPRAPNVGRRGSELHQFLQRPDGRLHLTKRVYSKRLACESPPVLCSATTSMLRDFFVARAPPQPLVNLRETIRARRFPRPTAWIRHAFPRRRSCQDPFVCLWALSEKRSHHPSPGQGCVTPFHGPM